MQDLWERYTPASRRLVGALFDGVDPAPEDVAVVRQTLHAYLASLNLGVDAREDIVQETLLLLISGVQRKIVDRNENLAAYIRTIALNCVRDAARYSTRRPVVDTHRVPEPMTDDGVASLLDALSSGEQVRLALAAATDDGEFDLAAFISDWLTLAERLGAAPSLREAAQAFGTNHMHVSRQIERFAKYLPAEAGDAESLA